MIKENKLKLTKMILPVSLFFVLISINLYCGGNGQSTSSQNLKDLVSIKDKMKIKCNQINTRIAKCGKKTEQILGESAEGGELVVYSCDGQNPIKALLTYYGEMGNVVLEYYFDKNDVFIVRESQYYDQPFYIKGYKVIEVTRRQYHLHDNNLVELLGDGKKVEVIYDEVDRFKKDIERIKKLLEK